MGCALEPGGSSRPSGRPGGGCGDAGGPDASVACDGSREVGWSMVGLFNELGWSRGCTVRSSTPSCFFSGERMRGDLAGGRTR